MPDMQFVSYARLIEDVRYWSDNLLSEDIVAVAGIPRSGVLPATLLAMHRNIHLVDWSQLLAGEQPWRLDRRRFVTGKQTGRVLVVDDSGNTGDSLRDARGRCKDLKLASAELLFGAVYVTDQSVTAADTYVRIVPKPRVFEWNVFHSRVTRIALFDMDGVLCCDPPEPEEDTGPGLAAWLRHLETAKPRYLPSTWIHTIASWRLEKYRAQTERWLERRGVVYQQLLLAPYETVQQRRAGGNPAEFKAEIYKASAELRFCIESDSRQAKRIAALSGKPVLCADDMLLYGGKTTTDG